MSDSAQASAEEEAAVAAFLRRYLEDESAGAVRALEDYVHEASGFGERIAAEYALLTRGTDEGERIGPYAIERELGRGAQGTVFLARDTRLKRPVALKVLDGLGTRVGSVLARFRREAEVASRLDHRGICPVYDSGSDGSRAYIAMRYVEGATLAAHVARARGEGRRFAALGDDADLDAVVRFFADAAEALHAAHEAGIVHRDIKPGNLMVTPEGAPVVLDFGLARDEETDVGTLTRSGDVFGTPAYMSPEQLGGARLDRQTDVYSLGASLYEALTLERPHRGPSLEALYEAIRTEEPSDPRRLHPAISRDLAVVVLTALEKDVGRRYSTAEHLAADLRRVLAREPVHARPAGRALRLMRWTQRNPALAGLVAVLALALVGALVVNAELQRNLADARAGRLSRKQARVEDLLVRGFQKMFSADQTGADALFEEALALEPENRTALAGRFWFDSDTPEDARAVLDRWAPESDDADVRYMRALLGGEDAELPAPSSDLQHYLRGLHAVNGFQPFVVPSAAQEGMRHFRRAMDRAARPWFHHAHSLMMAASSAGDRDVVDEMAAVLEHHWPDSVGTWDAIAQFYFQHDPERAEAAVRHSLTIEDNVGAHLMLAVRAAQTEEYDLALEHYARAEAVAPHFVQVSLMRGQLLRSLGRGEEALPDLERAYREFAGYPGMSVGYVPLVEELHGTEAAVAVLRGLEPEMGHLEAYWWAVARVRDRLRGPSLDPADLQPVVDALRKVLELEPDARVFSGPSSHTLLPLALEDALPIVEGLRADFPENAHLVATIAGLHEFHGDLEGARPWYEEAWLAGDRSPAVEDFLDEHVDGGQRLELLRRGAERFPDDVDIQCEWAEHLQREGDFAEARRIAERVVDELGGTDARALRILLGTDRDALDRLVETFDDRASTLRSIAEFLITQRGDADRIWEIALRAYELRPGRQGERLLERAAEYRMQAEERD